MAEGREETDAKGRTGEPRHQEGGITACGITARGITEGAAKVTPSIAVEGEIWPQRSQTGAAHDHVQVVELV
jgi:hypothetical protein